MSKKPYLIILIILFITTSVLGFLTYRSLNAAPKKVEIPKTEYTEPKKPTEYQKKIFQDLTKEKDLGTNRAEFGDQVAINFATDFLNLANKTSNTDIGGMQFILPEIRKDFQDRQKNGYYQYVPLYLNKKLVLPEVSNITITKHHTLETGTLYELEVTYANQDQLQTDILTKLTVKTVADGVGKLFISEAYSTVTD